MAVTVGCWANCCEPATAGSWILSANRGKKAYTKLMPGEKPNPSPEAMQASENGLKIVARMIVEALMKELSTQERIFGEAAPNPTVSFPDTNMTQQNEERLTFSVSEVARLLGVSRNTAYEATRAGRIASVRWGSRILVPRAGLKRMLEEMDSSRIDPGQRF